MKLFFSTAQKLQLSLPLLIYSINQLQRRRNIQNTKINYNNKRCPSLQGQTSLIEIEDATELPLLEETVARFDIGLGTIDFRSGILNFFSDDWNRCLNWDDPADTTHL